MAKYFVITIEGSYVQPFFKNVIDVQPFFKNVIGDDISDAFETIVDEIIRDSAIDLADNMVDDDGYEVVDHEDAYDHAYDIISGTWSNRIIAKEEKGICSSYKTDKRRDNSLIIINSNNIYWNKTAEIIEILNTLERLKLPSEHILEMINETAL